jgi:hypothetical protein
MAIVIAAEAVALPFFALPVGVVSAAAHSRVITEPTYAVFWRSVHPSAGASVRALLASRHDTARHSGTVVLTAGSFGDSEASTAHELMTLIGVVLL